MHRVEHPLGGSTLITSAPRSARIFPASAPFSSVRSSTRRPLNSSLPMVKFRAESAPSAPLNRRQDYMDVYKDRASSDQARPPHISSCLQNARRRVQKKGPRIEVVILGSGGSRAIGLDLLAPFWPSIDNETKKKRK